MNIEEVKEVQKLYREKEVNELLKKGWKLVSIAPHGTGFQYLLVRE